VRVLVLVAVLVGGCAPAGTATPRLAPTPSPGVTTVPVTLTRTSMRGASASIRIAGDGEWQFTPVPGSALADVINHGRLTPPDHARLARLLAAPALGTEAAATAGACPGGNRYTLDAGTMSAAWTDCDARPALAAVLGLVRDAEPDF
jgi:hypothetical protein